MLYFAFLWGTLSKKASCPSLPSWLWIFLAFIAEMLVGSSQLSVSYCFFPELLETLKLCICSSCFICKSHSCLPLISIPTGTGDCGSPRLRCGTWHCRSFYRNLGIFLPSHSKIFSSVIGCLGHLLGSNSVFSLLLFPIKALPSSCWFHGSWSPQPHEDCWLCSLGYPRPSGARAMFSCTTLRSQFICCLWWNTVWRQER